MAARVGGARGKFKGWALLRYPDPLTKAYTGERRSIAFAQEAARLAATLRRWCFHGNQLVIIHEASMVSTFQLAALVQQAGEADVKILLVGDPGQLDAIDAGGVLGWLDREGKTTWLSTIWRFRQEWERATSLSYGGELPLLITPNPAQVMPNAPWPEAYIIRAADFLA